MVNNIAKLQTKRKNEIQFKIAVSSLKKKTNTSIGNDVDGARR